MNAIDKIVLAYAKSRPSLRSEILGGSKEAEFIKLMRQQKVLSRIAVKNWRQAHQSAIDIYRPTREELMDVYDDALLDPHLQAVLQARYLNVLNIPVEAYDLETDEVDEELTPLIQKRWFYDATLAILESIPKGFTPIRWHFKPGEELEFEVAGIEVLPREHCLPEWNAIRPDVNGDELYNLEDHPYNRYYMMIDSGELGLLLPASRFTIFKKYGINHWNRYQDVFGVPAISATTTSRDEAIWEVIEQNIKSLSSALGGVFPVGTEVTAHEMKNTDAHLLFLECCKYADQQLSKLFLGGSGGMDEKAFVGSAEVQERTKSDIIKGDVRLCQHVFIDQIIPLLISWGYPFRGKGIRFNMSSKLKLADSQLAIDRWISQHFEIDESYVEETYGTRIIGRREAPLSDHSSDADDKEDQEGK